MAWIQTLPDVALGTGRRLTRSPAYGTRAVEPVFLHHFDQIDEDVLCPQPETFVQGVCYSLVKSLLHLEGAPGIQGDLQENTIVGAMDSQVIQIKLHAGLGMLGDYLETVIFRSAEYIQQSLVNDLADL